MLCTEKKWIAENFSFYSWYYDEYPNLQANGVSLPIPMQKLQLYYVLDMEERNLEPLKEVLNCYEHLFSYFLGRLTGAISFQGRGWLELTMENFPGAVSKTFDDIQEGVTGLFDELFIWLILIIVALALIFLIKS